MRLDVVLAQRILDQRSQVQMPKLPRRQVDGHAQRRQAQAVPGRKLLAGGTQHPGPDRQDHAGVFEHGDEAVRRHHAVAGPVPAQQRLDASELAATQIGLGLEVELEFLALDGAAQAAFERHACRHRSRQVIAEEAVGAAAQRFGAVHRHVGVADQAVEVDIVGRVHRDADAGRNDDLFFADDEGRVQGFEHAPRDVRRVFGVADVFGDHGELVATQARQRALGRVVAGQ